MQYALRLTQEQHDRIWRHLYPGDHLEAAALLVCGRRNGSQRHILTGHDVLLIPYNECTRTNTSVTWPTSILDPLLPQLYRDKYAVVKVHSHPGGFASFSSTDDASDAAVLCGLTSLLDNDLPHASAIMLPDGRLIGRVFAEAGIPVALSSIMVVGDDLRCWQHHLQLPMDVFRLRHAQAFGGGTTSVLRSLSVAVVGCSGTGSIVIEQLARLGVGRFVLIDPDRVEEKNLNRILNAGKRDAYLRSHKVNLLAEAIAHMGLGQEVLPLCLNVVERQAVEAVAECDIVCGCMDGAEGRHLLNRIATFYCLPYFDVGVRLDADGHGGIANISGAVHYMQPGRSSLLSRGVYTIEEVEAEAARRTNRELYERHRKEGYLRGIAEDRPAVISVNMYFAALAVNELLARLHGYRNQPNSDYAMLGSSLCELKFYHEPEGPACPMLQRYVGRGDMTPLLDRPALS